MDRRVLILVGGRAVQALLSVVVLRVMTSYLSPGEAGNYFLLLSFATGFAFFLVNPVGMYLNRRLHAWHDHGALLDRVAVFGFYLVGVSVLAFFTSALLKVIIGSAPGISTWPFAASIAVYLYCSVASMTLVPALNMLGHRTIFVLLTVLTTGLGLVFSLAAVLKMGGYALYWIAGQSAAMLAVAAAALYFLRKRTGGRFSGIGDAFSALDRRAAGAALAFSAPLAGATMLMWAQTQGYRLIVESLAGAEFLGFLAVGFGIAASLAAVAESLVQQVYYPGFYRKITSTAAQVRREALSVLTSKAIPAYLVLLLFTFSLAEPLAAILVSSRFQGAAPFIMFGAFLEFFRMCANILSSAAHSEMRTRVLIKPYLWGAIVLCAGVYFAAGSELRGRLVPLAMCLGGGITLLAVRREISAIVTISANTRLLLKSLCFSLPMLLFLLLPYGTGFLLSAAALFAGGIYFLLLQYLIAFKWTDPIPEPDSAEEGLPGAASGAAEGGAYE